MAPLVVIVGETASGKSALAMELAKKFDGELICADSRTIYKGMDIGTAKPSKQDQAEVPHHLLDVVEPGEPFTVAEFKQLANTAIEDIAARGKLPIMVGGSGLYIDSILFDFQFGPEADTKQRTELEALSTENLQQLIIQRGLNMPENKLNKRYLVRALERGDKPLQKSELRNNTLVLGMVVDRDQLTERIRNRVQQMIDAGLEGEAMGLAERYGWETEAMKGVGYREFNPKLRLPEMPIISSLPGKSRDVLPVGYAPIGAHSPENNNSESRLINLDSNGLSGSLSPLQDENVQELIVRDTLQLAKKQRTWFKRNSSVQPVHNLSEAVDILTTFLNKKQ